MGSYTHPSFHGPSAQDFEGERFQRASPQNPTFPLLLKPSSVRAVREFLVSRCQFFCRCPNTSACGKPTPVDFMNQSVVGRATTGALNQSPTPQEAFRLDFLHPPGIAPMACFGLSFRGRWGASLSWPWTPMPQPPKLTVE